MLALKYITEEINSHFLGYNVKLHYQSYLHLGRIRTVPQQTYKQSWTIRLNNCQNSQD